MENGFKKVLGVPVRPIDIIEKLNQGRQDENDNKEQADVIAVLKNVEQQKGQAHSDEQQPNNDLNLKMLRVHTSPFYGTRRHDSAPILQPHY